MGTRNAKYVVELQEANTEVFGLKSSPQSVSAGQGSVATSLISRHCKSTLRNLKIVTVFSKISVYI